MIVRAERQDSKRRLRGEFLPEQRQRNIVNGDVVRDSTFKAPVMSMPVKHRGQGIAVQGLFEPTRAHEGINLQRLAFDSGPNGRIMKDGNAMLGAKLRQGRL